MPLFLSEEEFRLCSDDASAVAERADAFIRDLFRQLDTVRAEADAASIAAEQNCALLEQRYAALSSDISRLRSDNAQLSAAAEKRLSELADAQAEKHRLNLNAIGKDGEIERLSLEATELHKSKRQLLELVEQKDAEIQEKNATIQSYLDKIVNLTDNATSKEARLHELESELARCHATCNRVTQEKELLEKHNGWLNEELTAKVNSLAELRRKHLDIEAEMSVKIAELERQVNESSSALKRSKERARELELRVTSLEEELCSSKDAAAANEEQFAAELSTVTKLAELYKTSSEEWSKKAGELEGVIKALETHLVQVENDYKEKLDNAMSVRRALEKEAMDLKEKLEICEAEIEKARKANEFSLVPISGFHTESNLEELSSGETCSDDIHESSRMLVPKVPIGISGTALAASLLREGWSLAKMYEKYQEAADALRHEKWGRKHSESILEHVLHEIEVKAEIILDERAEHERMVEAYTLLNQRLQQALSEHDNFENTMRRLKSELKRREREHTYAQKEIDDLQMQLTVLLKECQDVQLRCGATPQICYDSTLNTSFSDIGHGVNPERVITENLLSFKDINGLVEQNVKLRSIVRSLSSEEEERKEELKEGFHVELQKVNAEASAKIEAVLKRSEEQGRMIESLHSSVAMYKRLYEEERKIRASRHTNVETVPENEKKDLMLLFDSSQEVAKKAHEQLSERARNLEQDLERLRSELMSIRSERDKSKLEANFARERLDSFMKEFDLQRQEANTVSARNVELTHLLIDYQKRLRESSDSLQASEESFRKLSMEVSILKHEKDILVQLEKRASDEVRSLSERVYRLQSTLDTIQTADEVRENARATERRKHEEYLKRVERDWAEAKKELQEERDRVRALTLDRGKVIENSIKQVEEIRKELSDAWHAVASAESRAAVAEDRYSDLEGKINHSEKKVMKKDVGHDHSMFSIDEDTGELWKAKEEMEKLKEEARANKDYMLQYKEIAHTNEVALKQIESAHEEYKAEAEKLKKALEDEISSLRNKVSELESKYILKSEEAASAIEAKEKELSCVLAETSGLRDEISAKMTQLKEMELLVSSLKSDLDKEHKRWRTAQDNYERQVILQSEAIQELTNTSKELSSLQCEVAKLRQLSEIQKTENDVLKSSWEKEKAQLQELKIEAERKYNEINEQNKILHNRLESLHIRLADRERSSAGFSFQNNESTEDSELQNVISYLRRSKEIAETEISLLKQEKLRLQSQLEGALKASETAQALVHSRCESSRAISFKDEEFKSLQLQVREINLLRESNMQLREENRHNFEESQKFREEAHKVKMEAEKIANNLREKQVEYDACQKEIEMQKMETEHLKNRIAELLESFKHIDAEEFERMRNELQQNKVLLSEKEDEIQETKNQVSEKQGHILTLERDSGKFQLELAEQEKKLNDALQVETNIKLENEKQKKVLSLLKKKNESLTKEKEELNKENQSLLKQIEDSKSSRKTTAETLSEHAIKEKESRIQTLENTLLREREDLRKERDDNKKEKLRRQKTEKTVLDLIQTVNKDKKRVEEELAKHKRAISVVLENKISTSFQFPSMSALDEQTSAYFLSVDNIEEAANSLSTDGLGTQSFPSDASIMDITVAAAGRQVPVQQMRPSTSQAIATEERERGSAALKLYTEVRKAGRRLVRPRLERSEESTVDHEMPAVEGPTTTEGGKAGTSHDPEVSGDSSLPHVPLYPRKRLAPSPASELREESDDANYDVVPPLKKSKDSEFLQEGSEGQFIPSSSENPDTVQQLMPPSTDNFDAQPSVEDMEADRAPSLLNEEIIDMAKDEDNIAVKEEIEDQQKVVPQDGTNQDEFQYEGDTIAEEYLRGEDGKEIIQSTAEGDDEREEGELMSDDPEQQQEDGGSGECKHEPVAGDEIGMGGETGDTAEAPSPEVQSEKGENVDATEEVAEGSDKSNSNNNDHGAIDIAQSPQRSFGAREGSPSTLPQIPASDQQSPTSTAAEKEESRAGRTIRLREGAVRGRQERMAIQPSTRGRGRGAGVYRRDAGRGSRGGRSGRDREQG